MLLSLCLAILLGLLLVTDLGRGLLLLALKLLVIAGAIVGGIYLATHAR
jgi:hypothetical protein